MFFQWLFGYKFSVTVWVGYIACFGMATETGIIMLVYLREAIEKRGGLENIKSLEELRQAVITTYGGSWEKFWRATLLPAFTAKTKISPKLDIGLDRRAPWKVADRREHFDAAMKVHALFGEMSDLVEKIDSASAALGQRMKAQPQDTRLAGLLAKVDATKKKIVATKEGGAITGEERALWTISMNFLIRRAKPRSSSSGSPRACRRCKVPASASSRTTRPMPTSS